MKDSTLFKTFIVYISFNILGMIGISCYILADTFFVAQGLGTDGLTALNLAIPVFSFISGSGLMIGIGGGTRYSIAKAEGNEKAARQTFTRALLLAVLLASFFTLAGIFGSGLLASLLRADEQVFSMTQTYLRVILVFAPAFLLNNTTLCFVRNDGNPRLSMIAMLTGSFANIIMDYILIFPFKMGILGAAIATGFAPVISLSILSLHLKSGKSGLRLNRPQLSARYFLDILSLGVSSLIAESASGIVMIAINFIILSLTGNIGVAAYGIIANLSLVVTSIYTGIAQGIQPIVSSAHGTGKLGEVRKIYRYAVTASLLSSVLVYTFLAAARIPLIHVFNKEGSQTLKAIAEPGILLYFTAFFFAGINIISAMQFSSTARPGFAFLVSVMRGIAVILPCAFILSSLFGMTGVWIAFPAAESLTCVAVAGMLIYQKKYGLLTGQKP